MLRYYGDVSGKQSDEFVVFAGYLARARQWENFEYEWNLALTEAKARVFHATDFFNFRGEFEGWGGDRRKHVKFAKRFTAIAEKQTDCGVGRGVLAREFLDVLEPEVKTITTPHGRFTPLMFCITASIQTVLRRAELLNKQVAFVFEGDPGVGEAIDYVNWLRRKGESWTEGIASLTTGDKSLVPLQAADLLAHESWRYMRESIQRTGRARRKSLERLLKRNRVMFAVADADTLRPIIPTVRAFLTEHPDGLGPF